MDAASDGLDRKLRQVLCNLPQEFDNRYTDAARNGLLETLFRSLTNDRADYLQDLFPQGAFPPSYRLQDSQGVQDEAEYSPAAKGTPCGHILKPGEVTYHCATCTDDPTAVLCARCFAASDHADHQLHISISGGNSGCCDCGDEEAWKRPVNCAIHTASHDFVAADEYVSALPQDLQASIRVTIGRVLDYFCDVISCSPENLRLPKTAETVQQDETSSRLESKYWVHGDDAEMNPEFALVIWNDEKHTVKEVEDQVARACSERLKFGRNRANEANDIGRSVVRHARDLTELLRMAKVIEQIKITVTIRSSRDTFREQMCGTIIDWLSDIASCAINGDTHILRRTICEEMLQLWRVGSRAWNAKIGREGLDTHGIEQARADLRRNQLIFSDPIQLILGRAANARAANADESSDDDDLDDEAVQMLEAEDIVIEQDDDGDEDMDEAGLQPTAFRLHPTPAAADALADADATDDADEMDTDGDNDFLDVSERLDGEQPSPPTVPRERLPIIPAPEPPRAPDGSANYRNVPKLHPSPVRTTPDGPPAHWVPPTPHQDANTAEAPVYEDLSKNIRIDSMILFDLRLWKIARIGLRDLYISTVVKMPQFKRILGLRFAGLYTSLAQLYLIADREPDHSIINLSLQILTTPSICQEVIEKGNFLTNLMAILYTYLTTKQVGHPVDVDSGATLAFDTGAVANRRLFHFFSDLRYFLASDYVQAQIRADRRYLSQYLDLVKLLQGICPNVRAIGDHVEYETDTWISAALLTREVNKLCRQFSETYQLAQADPLERQRTYEAVQEATAIAALNSLGLERKRFEQGEIKDLVKFHDVAERVVEFSVEKGALSFHHPLHYTLSWLLEAGKETTETVQALQQAADDVTRRLKDAPLGSREAAIKSTISCPEDTLLALFDYPLRVCAWLAQMKANMWVRNGMSLRHQMSQYKSVPYRDVAHQRDLFLLQTSLVACNPARVLVSMIDRFGLSTWMSGRYECIADCEHGQMVDLAEDLIYLLINLLSDRDVLTSKKDDPESSLNVVRKEVAHSLCFKPMSYTDLTARLTERVQEHAKLQEVLEEMTRYKAPEGLNDTGMYELKEDHLHELDPFNSHFSKNQRDEAENIYKKWMGKKTKKDPEEVILEPKLHQITSVAYTGLADVVHTKAFATMMYYSLTFIVAGPAETGISITRVETFLHTLLQLALIATLEDASVTDHGSTSQPSFVHNATTIGFPWPDHPSRTIIQMLNQIWHIDDLDGCKSKIKHILQLFDQKMPREYLQATQHLDFGPGRFDTASPANTDSDVETKKRQALERKAKVMAQFQQQQQSFMDKQSLGMDWSDDELELDQELPESTETRLWKLPTGLCIQCREETADGRLYGTFAMITDAHILRETDVKDPNFVGEVVSTPSDLDRSMDAKRPFGVAGANYEYVSQMNSAGQESTVQRQGLSKGWPQGFTAKGPLTTSCGHIMHYACFETYYQSVHRRHSQQVARNHSERVALKEFVCPLCKALSNSFLPIVWRGTEQSYPSSLETTQSFTEFLNNDLPALRQHDRVSKEHINQRSVAVHHKTLDNMSGNLSSLVADAIKRSSPTIGRVSDRPENAPLLELTSVYLRLRDPLSIVARTSSPEYASMTKLDLNYLKLLLDTLANTVAAAEIAHRGKEAEFGTTLLTGVSQQSLTHMQIFAATVRLYDATCGAVVRAQSDDDYLEVYSLILRRIFASQVVPQTISEPHIAGPILCVDSFAFFVYSSMVLCPAEGLNKRHLLQLSLTAEIVRVVLSFACNPESVVHAAVAADAEAAPTPLDLEIHGVEQILQWIEFQLTRATAPAPVMNAIQEFRAALDVFVTSALLKAIKTYALVFLRKAAILFHIAHGVDFPTTAGSEASLPEIERLLHFLQLPPIHDFLMQFDEYGMESVATRALCSTWLRDWLAADHDRQTKFDAIPGIRLLHPAPFELIGLPKHYDVLLELSSRKRCPTTGKELTDPAMCLFCGEIFCSQSVCCMTKEHRGGCNAHVEKCSSPIGIFLMIRKCHIVLLHVVKDPKMVDLQSQRLLGGNSSLPPGSLTLAHGSFFPAPYLTKHGETDSGLRSKSQLVLSQKRYDRLLREGWLMGNIGSLVARRLEGEVNAGGWETL